VRGEGEAEAKRRRADRKESFTEVLQFLKGREGTKTGRSVFKYLLKTYLFLSRPHLAYIHDIKGCGLVI
jgi:hypothetical protein